MEKGRNERMRRESARTGECERREGGKEERKRKGRLKEWNNASESDAESACVEQRSLNAINRRAIRFSSRVHVHLNCFQVERKVYDVILYT